MRIYIILFISFKILSFEIYADGCTLLSDYEQKTFPFIFCNSNNLLYRCTNNPYNEWDGNTQLKPMKLNGCFEYDPLTYTFEMKETISEYMGVVEHHNILGYDPESGNPYYGFKDYKIIYEIGTNTEISGYNIGDMIFSPYDTYELQRITDTKITNQTFNDFLGSTCFNHIKLNVDDYPDTQENAEIALSSWMSTCNNCELNDQYIQDCCVKISWTKDPAIFKEVNFDPAIIPAFANSNMIPGSKASCMYDCENSYVILNQTDQFTGNSEKDPGNYLRHFFITGTTSKSGWYSLAATLMHEIGHLLGFGDQYSGDGPNEYHTRSIMEWTDFENPDRGLSDDDICMYMKMYCWIPPTGVEKDVESFESLEVYPNPTKSNTINIQFGNKLGKNISYEILSPIGILISTGNILPNENPKTIILENLSSGTYYIILKYDGIRESKRFIISK